MIHQLPASCSCRSLEHGNIWQAQWPASLEMGTLVSCFHLIAEEIEAQRCPSSHKLHVKGLRIKCGSSDLKDRTLPSSCHARAPEIASNPMVVFPLELSLSVSWILCIKSPGPLKANTDVKRGKLWMGPFFKGGGHQL